MKLFPFDTFVIHTKEIIPEIKKKLSEHVDDMRMFNSLRSDKHYQGDIYDNGFKVSRIISYKNSFLPILHGSFQRNGDGTDIIIKMKLHKFITVFMIIWIFGFGAVSSAFEGKGNFLPLIILVVFLGIIPLSFHWEGKKAKTYFNGIFK